VFVNYQILNQLKSLFHRDVSTEAAVLNAKKNRRQDVVPCKLSFINIFITADGLSWVVVNLLLYFIISFVYCTVIY
jgi:hypothetical protein